MLDPNDPETLVLDPCCWRSNAPCPYSSHTTDLRMPAWLQARTVIVDDVIADPRYLSCSIQTKSEIIVPIHAQGKIVGEIDIDSRIKPPHSQSLTGCFLKKYLVSSAHILKITAKPCSTPAT